MAPLRLLLPLLAAVATPVAAFNYAVTSAGTISLTDSETSISDVKTIFVGELFTCTLSGIEWEALPANETTDDYTLRFETSVGGVVQSTGTVDMSDWGARELASDLDCGNFTINSKGRSEISVTLFVDTSEASTSGEWQVFPAGVSIIPLLLVLFLAMTTQMVEFSLGFTVFVGACIVEGNVNMGFKTTLDTYFLNAITDSSHAYVYLFTLFLSGLVGMMEKSGGMIGFTKDLARHATTAREGAMATFFLGLVIFFDDYANTLLVGQTMRPLTDLLHISREKLSFLVDATAAPVASISPVSSWVGFEVSLIQTEIERIASVYGEENLTISSSGLAVFLQTVKYRYYPIFMIILMPTLIMFRRELGPMLVAERRTQVYDRTDGGDRAGRESKVEEAQGHGNSPRPDTPKLSFNMFVPICLLVFLIFFLLVRTGDDGSGTQSFMDKIEASDSYSGLLWGTMATAVITMLFYLIQITDKGVLVLPSLPILQACIREHLSKESSETAPLKNSPENSGDVHAADEESDEVVVSRPRSLVSFYETMEAFLYGMGRIFPALIVLTLAWAVGSIMTSVGADRLFSRLITSGVSAEALPTLSFFISFIMALATGTSWGTMTILFPLISLPTYTVVEGDTTLFYATIAGILSGSVAGDHCSPISDTTVLSALASDVTLMGHVETQMPYALITVVISALFGTIPIGQGSWPNIVGILLGTAVIILGVYFVCPLVISPTGRWDIFTLLYLKTQGEDHPYHQIQKDTITKYKKTVGEVVEDEAEAEEKASLAELEAPVDFAVEVGSERPAPGAPVYETTFSA